MTQFSEAIRIDAPRQIVWAKLTDLGAVQDFNPGVRRSYYTSEQREGIGASRHCDLKPFGSVDERILDWRDGEAFTLEIYQGKNTPPFKKALAHFSVQGDDDGAIVHMTLDYELKYGAVGRLMDLVVVRRQMGKVVHGVLRGLKRHLEKRRSVRSAA